MSPLDAANLGWLAQGHHDLTTRSSASAGHQRWWKIHLRKILCVMRMFVLTRVGLQGRKTWRQAYWMFPHGSVRVCHLENPYRTFAWFLLQFQCFPIKTRTRSVFQLDIPWCWLFRSPTTFGLLGCVPQFRSEKALDLIVIDVSPKWQFWVATVSGQLRWLSFLVHPLLSQLSPELVLTCHVVVDCLEL